MNVKYSLLINKQQLRENKLNVQQFREWMYVRGYIFHEVLHNYQNLRMWKSRNREEECADSNERAKQHAVCAVWRQSWHGEQCLLLAGRSIAPHGGDGNLPLLGRWFNKPFGEEAEAVGLLLQNPRERVGDFTLLPNNTWKWRDSFPEDTGRGRRQPTPGYPAKCRRGKKGCSKLRWTAEQSHQQGIPPCFYFLI